MIQAIPRLAGLALLTACLSACAAPGPQVQAFDARMQMVGDRMQAYDLPAETRRTFERSYYDLPFGDGDGPVTVLTTEYGKLRGYTLAPCRGGNHVCAGSPQGRAGTVTRQADYDVVTGTYSNRTFYLAPGGDGYMLRGHELIPLAWD